MTEKRYGMSNETGAFIDKKFNKEYTDDEIIDLLNELNDENEQLKNELRIYRKLANCRNCQYHNYDTLFGSDEDYEVCDRGNDTTEGICKDWREFVKIGGNYD